MSNHIDTSVQYLKYDNKLTVYKASVVGGELDSHEGNYVENSVEVKNFPNAPADAPARENIETRCFVFF